MFSTTQTADPPEGRLVAVEASKLLATANTRGKGTTTMTTTNTTTNTTTRIETDDFRTRISPGPYLAKTAATVYLSQGMGNSRRDLEYRDYQPGEKFEIPATVNGHWYGLEPNGDMFSPRPAVIETV